MDDVSFGPHRPVARAGCVVWLASCWVALSIVILGLAALVPGGKPMLGDAVLFALMLAPAAAGVALGAAIAALRVEQGTGRTLAAVLVAITAAAAVLSFAPWLFVLYTTFVLI